MRRLLTPRALAAVFGVLFVWCGFWLREVDLEPGSTISWDWLWPYVFAGAGVLGVVYALTSSRHAAAWSGSLMAGACVSRAWALFAEMVAGSERWTDAELVIRASAWVGFGFALAVVWAFVVMPRG